MSIQHENLGQRFLFVAEEAKKLSDSTKDSTLTLLNAMKEMQEMQEKVANTEEAVRFPYLNQFINDLETLSSQMNLFALNTSIEAARAQRVERRIRDFQESKKSTVAFSEPPIVYSIKQKALELQQKRIETLRELIVGFVKETLVTYQQDFINSHSEVPTSFSLSFEYETVFEDYDREEKSLILSGITLYDEENHSVTPAFYIPYQDDYKVLTDVLLDYIKHSILENNELSLFTVEELKQAVGEDTLSL